MPKAKKKPAKQLASAKKTRKKPGSGNPWAYKESLKPIKEEDVLSSDELLKLECRNHYRIRPSVHVMDEQSVNDVFRMFGEMLGQDAAFMRQWVRCFILTHSKFINKTASKYLSDHSLKLQEWAKYVNKGCKADILALFLLCIATDTHCFVHTRSGYWTTLANNPQSHTEYSQQCNLHLSYVGKCVYVQHEIRTVTVAYDIFGLPEPLELDVETETVIIGTCTADEQETLDKLFRLGITSSTTTETEKLPSRETTMSPDLPASESGKARYHDSSTLDISESILEPSTSSATTSSSQLTVKVKASKTKISVKPDTLDDQPLVDIPLPLEIDPVFESEKFDDPETSPDELIIEEPKYMKLYKTYIKSNLYVSLTRLTKDEIRQKTSRKLIKPCCKVITPRPVTVKANPTSARQYMFKLTRYGVR